MNVAGEILMCGGSWMCGGLCFWWMANGEHYGTIGKPPKFWWFVSAALFSGGFALSLVN